MHDKRKSFASCLTTFAVAAVAFMVVAPEPALAGMGTGNPPPPPPPPLTVKKRMFETSADSAFSGIGYPGQVVMHRPRDIYGGGTSCLTSGSGSSGGNFSYTVYEGESPSHRGYLFGCPSDGWTNQDIVINTDATLNFSIPDEESNKDFTSIANPSNGVITKWEWEYEIERNKETKNSGNVLVSWAARSIGKVFVPRNANARPGDVDKTPVVFQLKKLEGYDANHVLRMKWSDDPSGGRIQLVPQQTATLQIHKVQSVVQK